ncbi:MAG: TrkH family potassium uptake protein [Opitutales bacterium]
MNYQLVYKLQAIILGALTVGFGGSALIAATLDDPTRHPEALAGFLVSALVSASVGIALFFLGRGASNAIFRREALAVIGIGWISASLFGALPYYLILPEVDFAAALFESTSGFTTTGASVLSDLERLPRSILFWRSISQWIGGLGVIVLFVAVLSFLGAGAKVLFSRESSAQATELDTARVQRGIFRLMLLYFGLSAACMGALMLCGLDWFDALAHTFTTISTGGFSTRSGSIADFANPTLEWVIIVFMIIGGTSFIPMLRFLRGQWSALGKSTEIKAYLLLLLLASTTVTLIHFFAGHTFTSIEETIRASTFQVVSIMTTSGFATEDFDTWVPSTHTILLFLMAIGGCSGSTSGGAKVIRFVIAAKIALQHLERAYRAHVIRPLRVNREPLDRDGQEAILVFFVMLGLITIFGLLGVVLMEPNLSLEGGLSAGYACLFNIGPGLAEVGPAQTFGFLGDGTHVLLSLLMILGRVELFAVLVLFLPAFWKRY